MLKDLEALVNLDSPSNNKGLTDKAVHYAAERFRELTGGAVEFIAQRDFGDHAKMQVGSGPGQILVLGHADTVWPEGEAQKRPFYIAGGRAFGPGVFDMKCGLVQGLYAIGSLVKRDVVRKKIVFLVNTDEEVGSPTSREWIEKEARQSDAVFVLEPALGPEGKLKTTRKGVARYKLEIQGIPAHSGIDHSKGRSAIEELAHQVIYLHGLTDYTLGSTVNVGVISGGTGPNVVSGKAYAEVDLRFQSLREAERLTGLVRHLKPHLEGTTIQASGAIKRPPMEAETSKILLARAQDIAQKLGFSLAGAGTGGASDGCFTAALGIPTLDGLGAVGEGAHSLQEFVSISHILQRSNLLACLIGESMVST